MFRLPDQIKRRGAYREQTLKHVSKRTIESLEKQGFRYAVNDNAQLFKLWFKKPHSVYFTKDSGFVLPLVIKNELSTVNNVDGAIAYLEISGQSLQFLIFDEFGCLAYDIHESVSDRNKFEVITEINQALKQVSKTQQLNLYFADGNALLTKLSRENKSWLKDDIFKEMAFEAVNERSSNVDGSGKPTRINRLRFDTESGVISYGNYEVNLTQASQDDVLPVFVHAVDFAVLTKLSVDNIFKRPLHITHKLAVKPTKQLGTQKKVVGLSYFSLVGCLVLSAFASMYYLEQKRLEEQEALRRSAEPKIVDPWRNYRLAISDPTTHLQAENALMQTYHFLNIFERANSVRQQDKMIGWEIESFEATETAIQVTPISVGGERKALNNFSALLNLSVMSNDKGIQLARPYVNAAINHEVTITPVLSEVMYITDAMNWLFDDVAVSVKNKAINGENEGKYSVYLVKVDFKCWMAEDFMFAGTQFTLRNYALHSIIAKNMAFGEKDKGCEMGYSGELNLQVFGI
ncbi:hypothetical protein AAFX24_28375 [Vibrio mediterranei]|uniref:hypothetical protein n=1 Tax=Vibrio mediterranei TaxID=689 RepID=UPI0038CF0242